MKKLLLLILACGSPAWAAINVTEGSGKTVRTVTSGGQEVQVISIGDGVSTATISGTSLNTAVTNLPNTYTITSGTGSFPVTGNVGQVGTYAVVPATGIFPVTGMVNVTSTSTFTTSGNVGQVGTYAVVPATGVFSVAGMVNITSTSTINVAGSFSSVNVSTGTNGTTAPGFSTMAGVLGPNGGTQNLRVDLSSNVYVTAAGTLPIISTNTLTVMTTATVNVAVVNLTTITYNGVAQPVMGMVNTTSTSTFNVGVVNLSTVTYNGVSQPVNGMMNITSTSTITVAPAAGNQVNGLLTSATSVVASTFTPSTYIAAGFTVWPGTSTGITANFEISPDSGTTWILVHAYQNIPDPSNGKVAYQTYTLTTATTTFRTSVTGMTNFRVRASAWTTGIASVTITLSGIGDPGIQTMNLGQISGWVPLNGGSNGSLGVGGITALGSAPNSLPVHTGGLATVGTTLPTKRTDGTITNLWLTGLGSQVSTLDCSRDNIVKSSTTLPSNTTEVIILSSAAASTYNDMLSLLAVNTSTTAARVDFRSGGGPGGTTVDFALYLPAGDTRGMTLPHIWPQTTAASNWTAQASGSIVDIRLYATFCKSQ